MAKPFPPGFLWGAATASHQVEGNTHNDWTEWERVHVETLIREAPLRFGHLPHWKQIQQEAESPENYISGNACDHYTRFREDFDILKELNLNAYRFSIEWSRIEPEEGKFNEEEIEHYRHVIQALRERGIEPVVTLWHWSNPLWIRDLGDWSNPAIVDYFARYTEKIVTSLPEVTFWITVNEPNIHTTFAYIRGTQPPGRKNFVVGLRVFHNILKAHKKAYAVIHKYRKDARVGIAHSIIHFEPKNNFFINKILASLYNFFWNIYACKYTQQQSDFIGVNYYTRDLVGLGSSTKGMENLRNDLGWEIFPEGLYHVLKKLARFNLPLYITENGLADADDSRRADFIREHIHWMHKAIEEGIDVKGYLHWSLLDNNEFVELRGFWPKFGLVAVNRTTQERTVRPSARMYGEIAKHNALP